MGGNRSRTDRILLLVTGGRDRELLEEWLRADPDYEPVGVDSPADVETDD